MRPSRVLPPVEFWRGVQAEEGGELTPAGEKPASWIVAVIADAVFDRANAVNGHQPLGRLVSLDRRRKLPVDRADRLIQQRRVGRQANEATPRTQSRTTISPFSLKPSAAMRFRPWACCAPCGAIRPISARWPRKALSATSCAGRRATGASDGASGRPGYRSNAPARTAGQDDPSPRRSPLRQAGRFCCGARRACAGGMSLTSCPSSISAA